MLSTSLESATKEMMRNDSIAREDIVFGNDFVEHYGGTREHEIKVWNEAVTNWEGTSPKYVCALSFNAGHDFSGTISGIGMIGINANICPIFIK